MKLITARLKFILTSAHNHDVGKKKEKKAIYFSSLEYGASLGEIAEAEQIICSQLMEMQTKQKKTMNAK